MYILAKFCSCLFFDLYQSEKSSSATAVALKAKTIVTNGLKSQLQLCMTGSIMTLPHISLLVLFIGYENLCARKESE